MHELQEEHLKEDHGYEPILEIAGGQEFDYLFIFDENAKIIDCTSDIQKKLGYNKQEMMTLTLSDVAYLESQEEIRGNLFDICQ
jgi:hypothetical protein